MMIKIGIVGQRGLYLLKGLSSIPDVKVTAVCDLNERSLANNKSAVEKVYPGCDIQAYRIYEDMIEKSDIDAVIISSPQFFHVQQALVALYAGKHVLSEVTAAVTMDELWWLIDAVEKTGKTYMYAENYIYTPERQLVKEMVKKGVFGDIYYAEGEYSHDVTMLRDWNGKIGWRSFWQMGTRGAMYPTHALGPVMEWFEGDRIVSVSAFSPGNHNPYGLRADDLVNVMCTLESGRMVKIRVDLVSPHPPIIYYQLQGSKGCYETSRIDGSHHVAFRPDDPNKNTTWQPLSDFYDLMPAKYKDEAALGDAHGGGDYFEARDFVEAIKTNTAPHIDVYKAAEWTAVGILSELSVMNNGKPVEVPNFRQNMPWKEKITKF